MTNISQIFEQAVSFIQQKKPKALNLLIQKNPQLLQYSDSDASNQTLIHHTLPYANFVGDDPSLWSTPECADVLWKNGALINTKFFLRALSTADLPMVEWLSQENELPECIRGLAALDKTRELKGWFAKGKLQPNAAPQLLGLGKPPILSITSGKFKIIN